MALVLGGAPSAAAAHLACIAIGLPCIAGA
jgi:hypothetical protein